MQWLGEPGHAAHRFLLLNSQEMPTGRQEVPGRELQVLHNSGRLPLRSHSAVLCLEHTPAAGTVQGWAAAALEERKPGGGTSSFH